MTIMEINISAIMITISYYAIRRLVKKNNNSWSQDEITILTIMTMYNKEETPETTRDIFRVSKILKRSFTKVDDKLCEIKNYLLSIDDCDYDKQIESSYSLIIDLDDLADKTKETLLRKLK